MNNQVEEISLRDIYLILKKHVMFLLGLTLAFGLVALLLSFVLPATYSSQVVINVAVDNSRSELKAAPSAVGLSQGLVQLVENESLAQDLQEERMQNFFKAKFDDKKSLLTLTASGNTASLAFERARRFETVVVDYFVQRISDVLRTNLNATLGQTKLEIKATQDNLKRLEPLLKNNQATVNTTENAAAFEARGVNPQLARASNPALVNLTLQISQLKISLAAQQARQISLETLLADKTAFQSLLGQGFQVQVLSKPAPALEPSFPKPLLMTALAMVAGLLCGLVGTFVLEALRSPEQQGSNQQVVRQMPQVNPGD